jgi:hypothetical protein
LPRFCVLLKPGFCIHNKFPPRVNNYLVDLDRFLKCPQQGWFSFNLSNAVNGSVWVGDCSLFYAIWRSSQRLLERVYDAEGESGLRHLI